MNTQSDNNNKSRRIRRFFTIVLPIILILIILKNISFDDLRASLAGLNTDYLLIALILNIIVVMFMAFRWYMLYHVIDTPPSQLLLLKVTFVSILFNTILPSIIGGDAYRTVSLSSDKSDKRDVERSFSIVFVDRIIGLIALIIMGALGLISNTTVVIPPIVTFLTIVFLLAFVSALLLSMNETFYRLLIRCFGWLPARHFQRIERILLGIQSNIFLYRDRKSLLLLGLLISFAQRFVWLLGGYFIGQALHLDLSIMTFLVFLPVIEIIRLIPITIQGIGVREGLFIVFFGSVGVGNADAVLLATFIYLMASIMGLVGGCIYLFDSLHSTLLARQAS